MMSVARPMQQPWRPPGGGAPLPPLEPGDRLDQQTFHARYEAMPPGTRAELVGGVVYMPSPAKLPHGRHQAAVVGWAWTYSTGTPGVILCDNATAILGPDSEPQPDALLTLPAAGGGRTRSDAAGYLVGPPELVAEVASSTESYDLHAKKADYERAGVLEYVVAALRQAQVFWFVHRDGRYEPLPPGPDGIYRSETFPGLWLDPAALLAQDGVRLLDVLRQGMATPEHAAFAAKLAATPR